MADKPASYQLPTANRGPAMIVLNAPNPSIRNVVMATACFVTLYLFTSLHQLFPESHLIHVPLHAERVLAECASLNTLPGPSPMFWDRSSSERFEPGTKAQYIFNATIWTGLNNGTEVVQGDVFLQNGIIKAVGDVPKVLLHNAGKNLESLNAYGAWVTPGIFDLHSHIGVYSLPLLRGSNDGNSWKGLTLPWLRSLDGINVYDESIPLAIAGGVTSSLILLGSADAIGGQAIAIKLRPTLEGSPSSMVLEPPFRWNGTYESDPSHWRHIKHATGENPSQAYRGTRMDTMWAFRQAYEEARRLKTAQDEYCIKARAGVWKGLASELPKDLKWEALADVLRGKVKVNVHSYSPSDFDGLARLSNEFKFHIDAIHHAHEAYLVTPLLEKFYGGKPAVALFATFARYKQEAYRGSEFAPKILHEAGFDVVMKSDTPAAVLSRYLQFEAAQAHLYGLPEHAAIRSITTTPAISAGFGHRLGFVRAGYDADIVVWDSHPLAVGATPKQVYIDGIPQISHPITVKKPKALQKRPKTSNWDREAKDALKYKGLPPLKGRLSRNVAFTNVRTFWDKAPSGLLRETVSERGGGTALFVNGTLVCSTLHTDSACPLDNEEGLTVVDLEGGSLAPGLLSFGGSLGVIEIEGEPSTNDGYAYGPFDREFGVLGDLDRAVDGLSFEGRHMLLAYRSGVTHSISSPAGRSMIFGLSVALYNGAEHPLNDGAIVKDVTAVHLQIVSGAEQSVSTQIGLLRQILLSDDNSKVTAWFRRVANDKLPLVISVHSADVMAKLLLLKAEIEEKSGKTMKMAFFGAAEAHLIAKEIASAHVGVIVAPSRAVPLTWDSRRILPGPPLSQDTVITTLLAHNVTTAIGITLGMEARNTRFEIAWAALESNSRISKGEALALVTTNLEDIFGLDANAGREWVAYRGGDMFHPGSKVVAVVSRSRRMVELFDG